MNNREQAGAELCQAQFKLGLAKTALMMLMLFFGHLNPIPTSKNVESTTSLPLTNDHMINMQRQRTAPVLRLDRIIIISPLK